MKIRIFAFVFVVAVMAFYGLAHACPFGEYQGVSGDCVPRPDAACQVATARCRDGSYSHSEHHAGTCSSHGGVEHWCPGGHCCS
jgi:hypothetical protein